MKANELYFQFKRQNLKLFVKLTISAIPMRTFPSNNSYTTSDGLLTTTSGIPLVDSTVRINLCHLNLDSNVKYESNNITTSSSRQYHAGILIF